MCEYNIALTKVVKKFIFDELEPYLSRLPMSVALESFEMVAGDPFPIVKVQFVTGTSKVTEFGKGEVLNPINVFMESFYHLLYRKSLKKRLTQNARVGGEYLLEAGLPQFNLQIVPTTIALGLNPIAPGKLASSIGVYLLFSFAVIVSE